MERKDGLGVNGSLMCRQLVTDFGSERFQGDEHAYAAARRGIKPELNFQSKVGPDELSVTNCR